MVLRGNKDTLSSSNNICSCLFNDAKLRGWKRLRGGIARRLSIVSGFSFFRDKFYAEAEGGRTCIYCISRSARNQGVYFVHRDVYMCIQQGNTINRKHFIRYLILVSFETRESNYFTDTILKFQFNRQIYSGRD